MKKRVAKPAPEYHKGYLFPFACFTCRRSFKRAFKRGEDRRKCPHCGGDAIMLDRKFKAPRSDDVKQWRKVQELVEAGFRFDRVWRHQRDGIYTTAQYPEKLSEVGTFVRAFHAHMGGGVSNTLGPTSRGPRRPKS
jgi:hypothetical protein